MGKKRTNVGTSVSRVIADNRIPASVKTGVIKALFKDQGLTETVLEELVASIGVRAERMYTYGKDHYTHGLPSGQFTIAAENIDDVVGTVLLGIENVAVDIDYLHHGAPNYLHIGWVKLMEVVHGYNPATNQLAALTAVKATPVYLHDMVVVIPSSGVATIELESLQQWGIAARAGYTPQRKIGTAATRAMILPTEVKADPVSSAVLLLVTYVWEVLGVLQTDSFTIPITGYDLEADYFHVRYRVGAVAKYWMYKEDTGTYPTLDALFDKAPIANGSFFPFAYFRYNFVSEISNKTTPAYLTSKKLVSYLGIDYDEVAETINQNPDIADVAQAMMIMAVPANTTNEIEQRYLWKFFNSLFLASSVDHRFRTVGEAKVDALDGGQLGLRTPGIVVQDTRFKLSLENNGIYKRRKAGSIGAVNTYDSSFGTVTTNQDVTVLVGQNETPSVVTVSSSTTSHYYRRQISQGYYDEIQVVGLRTLFHIFGEYTAIGDEEDDILLIPIDRAISSTFSIPDREVLYARSMHFVFNSVVVTKVKWYQTGIFRFLLTVVAVIITIISDGILGPHMAALLAAGEYVAVLVMIAIGTLVSLTVQFALKLFLEVTGVDAALLIAIIAVATQSYELLATGALPGLPFAMDLIKVVSGLTDMKLQSDMRDLLGLAKEFELLKVEQTKLLDTAKELLGNTNFLSPFVIFGEKPEDFYNRTVHSGNIGVVGIGAISSFVSTALTLPDLDETLGRNTNE